MNLAIRHGLIQPFLGADRLTVPVIELAVFTVNVNVSACPNVLVALDRTSLGLPMKLIRFFGRERIVKRRPVPLMLLSAVDPLAYFRSLLRLDLPFCGLSDLGHMSALVRHVAGLGIRAASRGHW
jgi:hypothetical protein